MTRKLSYLCAGGAGFAKRQGLLLFYTVLELIPRQITPTPGKSRHRIIFFARHDCEIKGIVL